MIRKTHMGIIIKKLCLYIYIDTFYIRRDVPICIHKYIYIYMYMYIYINKYMYIYIYEHIQISQCIQKSCTYIYMHVQSCI
jgi:hypothetical protein